TAGATRRPISSATTNMIRFITTTFSTRPRRCKVVTLQAGYREVHAGDGAVPLNRIGRLRQSTFSMTIVTDLRRALEFFWVISRIECSELWVFTKTMHWLGTNGTVSTISILSQGTMRFCQL